MIVGKWSVEVSDDNSGDNGSNGSNEDTKTLRGKYEALRKEFDDLKGELSATRRENVFTKSGIKDISPRRMRIIERELKEDGLDLTPEHIREAAVDLGYAKAEDFKQQGQQGQQQGDQGQQTQGDPNANPNGASNGGPPDPYSHYRDNSDSRMFGMNNLANQGVPASAQITSAAQFDAAMNNAQSPEELDAIIRQSGGQFGVALEEDMM